MNSLSSTEFYTGAQIRVYFGHILVDDITSIEWSGNNTKRPVYGYASTQFDAVAQGQYIVQGQFLIPFKEVGYLDTIQRELKNTSQYIDKITSNIKHRLSPDTNVMANYGPRVGINNNKNMKVGTLTARDILIQEAKDGGDGFQNLVDKLESQLWGATGEKIDLRRPDEFDLADKNSRFVTKGFNILVTFGDVNNPNMPSTIKTISEVHLTGSQITIDSHDNVTYEQYSFFAKGTDETVGSYSIIGRGKKIESGVDITNPQLTDGATESTARSVPDTAPYNSTAHMSSLSLDEQRSASLGDNRANTADNSMINVGGQRISVPTLESDRTTANAAIVVPSPIRDELPAGMHDVRIAIPDAIYGDGLSIRPEVKYDNPTPIDDGLRIAPETSETFYNSGQGRRNFSSDGQDIISYMKTEQEINRYLDNIKTSPEQADRKNKFTVRSTEFFFGPSSISVVHNVYKGEICDIIAVAYADKQYVKLRRNEDNFITWTAESNVRKIRGQ